MSLPPIAAEAAPDPVLAAQDDEGQKKVVGRSPTQIALERLRHDKVAIISAAVVLFYTVIAIFAGPLTKLFGVTLRSPTASNQLDNLGDPAVGPPYHSFDIHHPFGIAPQTGYDLLAEWFYGARTSLTVAVAATFISILLGIVIGLIAGFSRGWVDKIIGFVIDVFLSLPFLLGAIAVGAVVTQRFGARPDTLGTIRFYSLIAILGFLSWMGLARLLRGEVLSLREREFVQAAQVIGVPTSRILFKELLPNLIAPIVVSISLGLPAFVSAEAGLAFLGIGITDRPSWGQTISSATGYYDSYSLYLWEPLIGILTLVMALNLLGDAVRDAFDPKTRR